MLRTDIELAVFARRYAAAAGLGVDLDYLRRARVRAFFDGAGRMLGGYVINDHPPFRYVQDLGMDAAELLGAERVPLFRESTCIWMDRRLGELGRMRVYLRCVRDLGRGDRRYILGGSIRPGVAAVQRRGLPHLVFDGAVELHGQRTNAWVYYGTAVTMWRGALLNIVPRLWRGLMTALGLRRRR